ncbi:MAG TPA: porin family protein, partial [Chitinophagaceae bacterium]
SAQKATFGFSGGLTMSSYKTKSDGDTYTSKSKTGFTAGFVSDIPLSKSISLQPALQFTQKGGIDKETFDGEDYKMTITFNYLEVPVNIVYKTRSAKTKFYIGAGPSIALGLSGKGKVESGGETVSAKVKFGSGENDDFKGLDAGANMLAGLMFKNGVSISMNYNMGFSNLVIGGDKNNSLHNNYWGLRVGYMLKGKKK